MCVCSSTMRLSSWNGLPRDTEQQALQEVFVIGSGHIRKNLEVNTVAKNNHDQSRIISPDLLL
jgi:hypothetical protein